MNKGWTQFLLVAVPILSLVGSWLALRPCDARRQTGKDTQHEEDGKGE